MNATTVLFVGLAAASTAGTLVRLTQAAGMPSLCIAAGRLLIATLVFLPFALARHRRDLARLRPRDWSVLGLSGLALAIHFAAWISSLEYTSVLATAVFGSTSPIFVSLLSLPFLGERVERVVLAGILITFAGGIVVAWSGDAGLPPTRPEPLLGNSLAVLAALAFAVYLLIGRRSRRSLPLVPYVTVVYGCAGCFVLAFAVACGQSIRGYSGEAWGWLLVVGLVPQVVGHSSFNFALGALSAAYVGLVSRLEPVGSALLAGVVLGEWPDSLTVVGSAVIVAGVALPGLQRRANVSETPDD